MPKPRKTCAICKGPTHERWWDDMLCTYRFHASREGHSHAVKVVKLAFGIVVEKCSFCETPTQTKRYWAEVLLPICEGCERSAEAGKHPMQARNQPKPRPRWRHAEGCHGRFEDRTMYCDKDCGPEVGHGRD